MVKQSQIVAVVGGLGTRATATYSTALKTLNHDALFSGLLRTFEPKVVGDNDDASATQVTDHSKVQRSAADVIEETTAEIGKWLDACLTRDSGNMAAKASVVVDGVTIVKDAPVPFLLNLADQLGHIRKMLESAPTLSDSRNWTLNDSSGLWESDEERRASYKTVKKPLVLHAPTDKHPAQTTVIDEEVFQGHKVTRYLSGALHGERKRELLKRVSDLQDAVKMAIQEANATEVEQRKIGSTLFDWLLAH
jgi:hypothetical protein